MNTKKIAESITKFLMICTILAGFYYLADIMVFRIFESIFSPSTMFTAILLIVGCNIALIVITNIVLAIVGVIIKKCKKSER